MEKLNPAYIEKIIETVNSSPFPRHISMTLNELLYDRAVMEITISKEHFQPFEMVHGGVVATLIDSVTFWAVFCRIPEDAGLVNVDLKLNYLQPVVGGALIAYGKAIRTGRSISYAEAKIFNADNKLIAHGTSTLMTLPGKAIHLPMQKFINNYGNSTP